MWRGRVMPIFLSTTSTPLSDCIDLYPESYLAWVDYGGRLWGTRHVMQWILVLVGVILAVVAIFALQNPAVVTLRFLNLSTDASVLVVILLAFAAGVFVGILALLPSSIRKSGRLRKAASELRGMQKRDEVRDRRTGSAPTGPPAA